MKLGEFLIGGIVVSGVVGYAVALHERDNQRELALRAELEECAGETNDGERRSTRQQILGDSRFLGIDSMALFRRLDDVCPVNELPVDRESEF